MSIGDTNQTLFYIDNVTGDCIYNASAAEPREFSYPLAILFGIPASLIIFITSVGNLFVLCFKARVGKRQTMLLIWNLGLADFLVGSFVLPLGVAYIIGRRWPFGRLMCKIWTACDLIFCTASIVTLCVISVDRYIGVTRPLRYKLIVTKSRIVFAIVGIWAFSILILLATNNYSYSPTDCYNEEVCHVSNELKYVVHSVITAFFIPAIVTLFLYWKIYTVARQRERGLQQGLMLAIGDNFLRSIDPLRVHRGSNVKDQQKVIRMHKRVAKTLGIVVSVFLICWLPFFTMYLIAYHCDCIPGIVLDILTWMGYCNSMINPIIYAFTVDEFKDSLKSLFTLTSQMLQKQLTGCHRRTPNTQTSTEDRGSCAATAHNGVALLTPSPAIPPGGASAFENNRRKWARSSRAYSMTPLPRTTSQFTCVSSGSSTTVRQGSPTCTTPANTPHSPLTPQVSLGQKTYGLTLEPTLTQQQAQARTMNISRQLISPDPNPDEDLDPEKIESEAPSTYHFSINDDDPSVAEANAQQSKITNLRCEEDDEQLIVWSAKLYTILVNPRVTGL